MKPAYLWWLGVMLACVISISTLSVVLAQGNALPNGKRVSVSGTMSCTVCRLSHPDKMCAPGCCEQCIKNGDPVLFTDLAGNQYVLAPKDSSTKLMTTGRYALLGKKVLVKGWLMKGKGVQVIVVDSIAKI